MPQDLLDVLPEPIKDPHVAAEVAGLTYVTDESAGIARRKSGKGFFYVHPNGTRVTDEETLARIRSLAIPPAYRNVWICPDPNGHVQAVGQDERKRKQYRYHPKWRMTRDENKFARMMHFGAALPKMRAAVARDLARPGLGREKVLATIVQLLEKTAIRVGNEEYAKTNKSYGLTTFRNRHAKIEGSHVHFEFKGKSGVRHAIDLQDRKLANVIRKLQELPGQELFQFVDSDGARHHIGSHDVNEYLHAISGEHFTAKDFRTWTGTLLASLALQEFETFDSNTKAKKNVMEAIKNVASKLGNTPTVCRNSYIHPFVLESYMDGSMAQILAARAEQELDEHASQLRPEEAAVLGLLQARLARAAEKSTTNEHE